MDNIEIKRIPNKRNMQSLLDQSAIDNTFNYEAQQLRQAYNKTIRDLNQMIKDQQRMIAKLELEIKQKDQIIHQQQEGIVDREGKLGLVVAEKGELVKTNGLMKKRLYHLEYKLETIEKNRNVAARQFRYDYDSEEEGDQIEGVGLSNSNSNAKLAYYKLWNDKKQKQLKKQIYKQITLILNNKIAKFVKDLKRHPMSLQLQQNIQSFLQDILYINSNQSRPKIFQLDRLKQSPQKSARKGKIGKIVAEKKAVKVQRVSDLQQWKKMQKSLQKLKATGSNSPLNRDKDFRNSNLTAKLQNRRPTRYDYSPYSRPVINYI